MTCRLVLERARTTWIQRTFTPPGCLDFCFSLSLTKKKKIGLNTTVILCDRLRCSNKRTKWIVKQNRAVVLSFLFIANPFKALVWHPWSHPNLFKARSEEKCCPAISEVLGQVKSMLIKLWTIGRVLETHFSSAFKDDFENAGLFVQ